MSEATGKPIGTVDIDPMFSPNSAEIIFTNTSNDLISQKDIYTINLNDNRRELVISNAEMVNYQ